MSRVMPGMHENVVIRSHKFREVGQKQTPLFELTCELRSGDEIVVNIWMSEKAMGMARRRLKLCGFDPDRMSLADLQRNPRLLAGNVIKKVDVEVDRYGPKGEIPLKQEVDEDLLGRLTAGLRSAKKGPEEPVNTERADPPRETPQTYDDDIPF